MAEQHFGFERKGEGANRVEQGRREFLRQAAAAVAALVFRTASAEAKETKSLLPEGVDIRSVADLERLIEALLPAVREDFAAQDAQTKTLKKKTGKAPPVNGERFWASAKDLAERIQRMAAVLPSSALYRMDAEIDERFRTADKRLEADFSSKPAALDDINVSQLSSLSLMVPRIHAPDFWERMDRFDAGTGAQSHRVPPTPSQAQDRAFEQRGVRCVAAIVKGHQSIVEYVEKYHQRNPEGYGKRAFVLASQVDAPFALADKNGSRSVSLAKP